MSCCGVARRLSRAAARTQRCHGGRAESPLPGRPERDAVALRGCSRPPTCRRHCRSGGRRREARAAGTTVSPPDASTAARPPLPRALRRRHRIRPSHQAGRGVSGRRTEPKVRDLEHTVVADQQVSRLEVAVQDRTSMAVRHAAQQLHHHRLDLRRRQRFLDSLWPARPSAPASNGIARRFAQIRTTLSDTPSAACAGRSPSDLPKITV